MSTSASSNVILDGHSGAEDSVPVGVHAELDTLFSSHGHFGNDVMPKLLKGLSAAETAPRTRALRTTIIVLKLGSLGEHR